MIICCFVSQKKAVSVYNPGNIAVVGFSCVSKAMCGETSYTLDGYLFTDVKVTCCTTNDCNSPVTNGTNQVNRFSIIFEIFLILSFIICGYKFW